MTKKRSSEFWLIKRFFREKLGFFGKSRFFSKNCSQGYRNLILGFLGFFYWPILGLSFFQSGNAVRDFFLGHVIRHFGRPVDSRRIFLSSGKNLRSGYLNVGVFGTGLAYPTFSPN